MNKKIISLATTALCTLSLSVTALGAEKTKIKLYTPSLSYNCLSEDTFKDSLDQCIKKLKEHGIYCDINWDADKNCTSSPETMIPPAEDNEKPSAPENNAPSTDTDIPSYENDTITSSNQTAKEAAFAAEVVDLVNKERADHGLNALSQDLSLQAAAQKRSVEQTELFSHTRPNGNSCFSVLGEYGITYKGAGENIAYGQKTPEDVVEAWMNSEGHRANILSKNFTDIGVGCYISSSGTIYWTQMFVY